MSYKCWFKDNWLTGWCQVEEEIDNITVFHAAPEDIFEGQIPGEPPEPGAKFQWKRVLNTDGKIYRIEKDNTFEFTAEEKEAKRTAEVDQQIREKLPELMRIIALDDLKGFEDLKTEIKAIDQSITKETI